MHMVKEMGELRNSKEVMIWLRLSCDLLIYEALLNHRVLHHSLLDDAAYSAIIERSEKKVRFERQKSNAGCSNFLECWPKGYIRHHVYGYAHVQETARCVAHAFCYLMQFTKHHPGPPVQRSGPFFLSAVS